MAAPISIRVGVIDTHTPPFYMYENTTALRQDVSTVSGLAPEMLAIVLSFMTTPVRVTYVPVDRLPFISGSKTFVQGYSEMIAAGEFEMAPVYIYSSASVPAAMSLVAMSLPWVYDNFELLLGKTVGKFNRYSRWLQPLENDLWTSVMAQIALGGVIMAALKALADWEQRQLAVRLKKGTRDTIKTSWNPLYAL